MGKGCTAFWKHINQSGRLSSPSASLEGRPPEPLCTGSPYSTSEDTMVPFNLTLRGSFLKPALSGFCALLKAIRSLRTSIFAPGFKRSSQPPADMELPCPTARARRPPPRRSRRASPACSPPDRLSPRRRGAHGGPASGLLRLEQGEPGHSQIRAPLREGSGRGPGQTLRPGPRERTHLLPPGATPPSRGAQPLPEVLGPPFPGGGGQGRRSSGGRRGSSWPGGVEAHRAGSRCGQEGPGRIWGPEGN